MYHYSFSGATVHDGYHAPATVYRVLMCALQCRARSNVMDPTRLDWIRPDSTTRLANLKSCGSDPKPMDLMIKPNTWAWSDSLESIRVNQVTSARVNQVTSADLSNRLLFLCLQARDSHDAETLIPAAGYSWPDREFRRPGETEENLGKAPEGSERKPSGSGTVHP